LTETQQIEPQEDRGRQLPLGAWIFSTDDHLLEGSYTFAGRVPHKYADEAPRIVDHDGGDAWLIEGKPVAITFGDAGGAPVVGTGRRPGRNMKYNTRNGITLHSAYLNLDDQTEFSTPTTAQQRWDQGIVRVREDLHPGVYDVHARISDMNRDGVWASVTIPSMSFGFAGQRFSLYKDEEVGLACVRAYNDWLYEEVAGAYPERFVCSAVPWLRDPKVAAQEVYRNASRGFTATLFPENPERFGFPSVHTRHWDPILAACEETGTVLNVHLGTGLEAIRPSSDSPITVGKAATSVNSALSAFDWVFSTIPIRFPEIKVSFTEGGIDFVPLVYGRLETLTDEDLDGLWDAELSPAEVLLRNFWFSALYDIGAYRFLTDRAPDHIMVETDYPHGDTRWPHSQEHFAERLKALSLEEREKCLQTNAVALYRHPIPHCPPGSSDFDRT
jgi:predicted TIM-barrel fold metal-dependent hydrolase